MTPVSLENCYDELTQTLKNLAWLALSEHPLSDRDMLLLDGVAQVGGQGRSGSLSKSVSILRVLHSPCCISWFLLYLKTSTTPK